MKNLALGALFVGLMACGGGSNNTGVIIVDGSTVDALTACNPLLQSGCNAGEKCTWVSDQDDPPIGHVGCAPDGSIPLGGACTDPVAGPTGYDTCVKGTVCLSGECKQICDQAGGAPACDTNHSCQRYADFFETGGVSVAGVCDPACDPLTQDLKIGTAKTACGSPMPAMPSKGCFGVDDFSCAPTGMTSWTLTDRQPPRTNSAGNPYLNGCAPGFMPLIIDMTGSMKATCSGLCAALETDNTTAHMNNEDGDAAALGKLPTQALPTAGNSTCAALKKGSAATSVCKYLWPYAQLDDGTFAAAYTPYLDVLGLCMDLAFYNYDNDGVATTPNVPYPNCKTLPPNTPGVTDGDDDDAADWLCQKFSNTPAFTGKAARTQMAPPMRDIHVPAKGGVLIERHILN